MEISRKNPVPTFPRARTPDHPVPGNVLPGTPRGAGPGADPVRENQGGGKDAFFYDPRTPRNQGGGRGRCKNTSKKMLQGLDFQTLKDYIRNDTHTRP